MIETSETQVPKLERVTPEQNALEKFSDLFYCLSAITAKSLVARTESDRPFSLRAKRAELYEQVRDARRVGERGEAEKLVREAHLRDEIAEQYLTQGRVEIKMKGLGRQTARYTEVKPPAELKKNLPTIYLIPGISNDLDCVGWLIQELARRGRTVLCVGFPESYMGKTTEEFAEAVRNSAGYGPHSRFFGAALDELIPNNQTVELWGHSIGASVGLEMLQEPELQERVTQAVLICPASVTEQSFRALASGTARESFHLLGDLKNLPRFSLSSGRKKLEEREKMDPKQLELRNRILKTLLVRVRTKMERWKTAKVKEGGMITIVSLDQDHMTKSSQEFTNEASLQLTNSQIKLLRIADCYHTTPLIYPEVILPQIFQIQGC